MISETFLQDLSLSSCLWQSTMLIGLGLLIGYFLRHRPSRAYQVLLFAMIGATIVPLMSALIKHYDLGIFTASSPELTSVTLNKEPLGTPLEQSDNISESIISTESGNPESLEITPTKPPISWRTIAINGWMIITIALLARLAITFI
jgi:hypothetical protein